MWSIMLQEELSAWSFATRPENCLFQSLFLTGSVLIA